MNGLNGRLNEKDFNLSSKDFYKLDKAFRRKHDEYMQTNSYDYSLNIFSRDEQIERYAKELSFWRIEMKLTNNEKNKNNVNKKHFIEKMEHGILSVMMMTFDNEMERLIEKRCEEIINI